MANDLYSTLLNIYIYVFIEVISDLSLVHFRHNKGKIINIGIKYIRGIKMVDINTLRPRQDGRHFPDDIFKCIFLDENV